LARLASGRSRSLRCSRSACQLGMRKVRRSPVPPRSSLSRSTTQLCTIWSAVDEATPSIGLTCPPRIRRLREHDTRDCGDDRHRDPRRSGRCGGAEDATRRGARDGPARWLNRSDRREANRSNQQPLFTFHFAFTWHLPFTTWHCERHSGAVLLAQPEPPALVAARPRVRVPASRARWGPSIGQATPATRDG
jgi:hypothetical protein